VVNKIPTYVDPSDQVHSSASVSGSGGSSAVARRNKRDGLAEFWRKSDAAILNGMPTLSELEINREVSILRGNSNEEE
jgi:hypothetical protein